MLLIPTLIEFPAWSLSILTRSRRAACSTHGWSLSYLPQLPLPRSCPLPSPLVASLWVPVREEKPTVEQGSPCPHVGRAGAGRAQAGFAQDPSLPLQGSRRAWLAPGFVFWQKLGSQLQPAASSILFRTVCKCFIFYFLFFAAKLNEVSLRVFLHLPASTS